MLEISSQLSVQIRRSDLIKASRYTLNPTVVRTVSCIKHILYTTTEHPVVFSEPSYDSA
jgi:hypothetical protein